MVVERARGESQSTSGSLQSLCWGSSAFGGIVSSYFSGSLLEAYGARYWGEICKSKYFWLHSSNYSLLMFSINTMVQVCFWCHSIASIVNVCSCCSCKRTAYAWYSDRAGFFICPARVFGKFKTEHYSAVGFCTTTQYFSSHVIYFLVASNPAVWLCYVLL